MKLYVDTTGKQVTVSKPTEPKNDQNGSQRSEKGTGRPMWSTQVIVLDETAVRSSPSRRRVRSRT